MKISQAEIEEFMAEYAAHRPNDVLWQGQVRLALEAAYRVRKARKKAAKVDRVTKAAVQGVGEDLSKVVCTQNSGFFANLMPEQQAAALAYRGIETHGENEAALRKLYSETTKEFPGVSG